MNNRLFIVILNLIVVCVPLHTQEIKDSVPLQPEEPNNSVPLNPQETKNPTREIQADVKLGTLLFLAPIILSPIDLGFALSYKIRHSEHIWYGAQMDSHLLGDRGESNGNHQLYSVSGVILGQSIYRYGYLSSMIGLGLVWLRYNENYDNCTESTWFNFFGHSSCFDWTPPPDRWSNHLGLSIPVSLQFGIRIYAIKVGLSLNGGLMLFRTALAERLTPIQLGASVGYLW